MSSDSVVIAAIDRAISLKSTYNIRVMNLSIGRPIYESYRLDPICAAVTAAWKQGIVVVVAAGNLGRDGYATITSPGNDPYAITVGAMKTEGTPQTQRRPDRQLQLARADLDRLRSQAGYRGAGQSGPLPACAGFDAFAGISGKYRSGLLLHDAGNHGAGRVFRIERHQHGHSGGQRRGRDSDPERSQPDAGQREGAADEDRVENLPGYSAPPPIPPLARLIPIPTTFSRSEPGI